MLKSLRVMAVAAVLVPLALFGLVAWEGRTQRFHEAELLVRHTVHVLSEHAQRVLETQALVPDHVNGLTRGMSWQEIAASQELHRDSRAIDEKPDQVASVWLIEDDVSPRLRDWANPTQSELIVPYSVRE